MIKKRSRDNARDSKPAEATVALGLVVFGGNLTQLGLATLGKQRRNTENLLDFSTPPPYLINYIIKQRLRNQP
jgi:hypothetical protein